MHVKAGLFSAVLTAFIIDRNQSIQPTPAQQSAFYQNQTVVLLNQISQQLSSLGAQIPDPSNSLLPGFTLSPSASDVRVNIIWIISLVSSLTAALLATLIQQWFRDRMRLFQGYSAPLEVARIRQYLHEGTLRTYMVALAEAVPGLVHVSLFLFLIGLADFLLTTYATVGRSTLFAIVLCAALYIIITVLPVANPQSPYRTPFSPLVWYITRWPKKRSSRGLFSNTLLSTSTMAKGRLDLVMKKGDARKNRDAKAIRWLVDSLTSNEEDLELLALRIPGFFDTTWGIQVWKHGLKGKEDKLFRDMINHLSETCGDRGPFKSDDDKRRVRSLACADNIAVFVFFMNADPAKIGNLGKLLSDIGDSSGIREVAEMRSNQSFAIRWTCLSLLSIRNMLDSSQWNASDPLKKLTTFHPQPGDDLDFTATALRNALMIDGQFAAACNHVKRLRDLRKGFDLVGEEDWARERIADILRQNESELTPILDQVRRMEELKMDAALSEVQQQIHEATHDLIRRLPGVAFDDDDDITRSTTVLQALDMLANPIRPQFIRFSRLLLGLCGVNEGWCTHEFQEIDRAMQSIDAIPSSLSKSRLMERQLWRLYDLHRGSFGYTLELYFLSVGKLLLTFSSGSPPGGTHQIVFVKTFKAITFDWQRFTFTDSIGTRQIILNIVLDIAFRGRGIFSDIRYPDYITTELLGLLRGMIAGQADAYIEDARREIYDENLARSIMVDPQFLPTVKSLLGPPAPAPAPHECVT